MLPPLRRLCICILLTTFLSFTTQNLLLPLTSTIFDGIDKTPHQLLRTATLRSSNRHHQRRAQRRSQHDGGVSLPLTSGSDYTLSFSVGTHHPQKVTLYMDTGSDLVWLPCSPLECILCDGKPTSTPLSNSALNHSTSVSCTSPSCSAVHSSLRTSDLCAIAGCPLEFIETDTASCSTSACPAFYYAYGDGSLVARLRQEHVSIPSGSGKPIHIPKFTFGCAHTSLGEPIGVAGFGRGVISLPAQISELSPHLGKQFSYCLISHSFDSKRARHPSPLILGRRNDVHDSDSKFTYTPMIDNPKHPHYYSVGLRAISIGDLRIQADNRLSTIDGDGNGGLVIDSGTTFTMLPSKMYEKVKDEFAKTMVGNGYLRSTQMEDATGLSPCYHHGRGNGKRRVPKLVLHFSGNASLTLPRRNYYMGLTRGGKHAGCLMLINGGDETDDGPAGTLGNIQQQGFEVVYDLEGGRVGFARKECSSLWTSMSKLNN
ncbi:Eukaryotic aspartyl protease family protein [Zostera marina]|uniref:Eukaryotic aspartyl protease family protein n=1 Tax=Zostera marina TaxID=29655 RepID=A0A0K9PBG4_ZOSMR|nr:Eukaryotic aspartyl protease family protein [Zostera marina]